MRPPEPSKLQRSREAAIKRAAEPLKSQLARQAAAIEHIVDLIRSRIAPAGDDLIKNEGAPVIASGEVNSFDITEFVVEYSVNYLSAMFAHNKHKSPWGIERENTGAIKEVLKDIQTLQRSLDKLPNGLRYLITSNETPGLMSLKFRATMAQQHPKALTRFRDFTVTLKAIEAQCAELLYEPPGERPNTNYGNKLIAACSADLLDYHGLRPTRGNEAKPSLFEQIASELRKIHFPSAAFLRKSIHAYPHHI
jgi:hypothetical protein